MIILKKTGAFELLLDLEVNIDIVSIVCGPVEYLTLDHLLKEARVLVLVNVISKMIICRRSCILILMPYALLKPKQLKT
jgi:hypothetical protein